METKKIKVEKQIIKEHPYKNAGVDKIRYSLGLFDGWIWRWKNYCWNKPKDLVGTEQWIDGDDKNFTFTHWMKIPKTEITYQGHKNQKRQIKHDEYVSPKY